MEHVSQAEAILRLLLQKKILEVKRIMVTRCSVRNIGVIKGRTDNTIGKNPIVYSSTPRATEECQRQKIRSIQSKEDHRDSFK